MEGGELGAERLAAAGGQQGEDVAVGEGGVDDLALQGPNSVAEGLFERVQQVGHAKGENLAQNLRIKEICRGAACTGYDAAVV